MLRDADHDARAHWDAGSDPEAVDDEDPADTDHAAAAGCLLITFFFVTVAVALAFTRQLHLLVLRLLVATALRSD